MEAVAKQRLGQDLEAWRCVEGGVIQSTGQPDYLITNPNLVTDTNT
jgi:hypothetical protein